MSGNGNSRNAGGLPTRTLGKTGRELSIIGLGGIVLNRTEQDHANRIVAEALDRGVTYFDVAPGYGDAEERMGPALEGKRDGVFLACKTTQRERAGSQEELDRSLKRLKTDRFDTYQLHALSTMEQLDTVFGPDGAMETFGAARKAGKILNIGFSAHSATVALEAMDRFDFDTILFPFNYFCMNVGDFGPKVLEKAQEKGLGRLALKSMAHMLRPEDDDRSKYGKCWYVPIDDPHLGELALRYTLSLPLTAALPPGEEELFKRALKVAENFEPLSSEEEAELEAAAAGVTPISANWT
jgi:aryl-alcohol dehydrogenase-like predicted oxidoreductase